MAAAGAAITGTQVLTLQGQAKKSILSESLWVNLLLSMAYQRDAQLQKYARRMGQVNTFTLLSVVGVSALGLTQSIVSLHNTHDARSLEVEDHNGDLHAHQEADSRVPATLGLIGSGATIATLGVKAVWDGVYGHKLAKRQAELQVEVASILEALNAGTPFREISGALSSLIGETATQEFQGLWQAAHR